MELDKSQSTAELIAKAYVAHKESDDDEENEEKEDEYWRIIAKVTKRGSSCEFHAAKNLTESKDIVKRQIGANILGELGWTEKTFHEESIAILILLLSDEAEDVIASAAFALGHRNDARGIPHLVKLIEHNNPSVRYGVVSGLSGFDDERAVEALIQLSRDSDYDVRNWATFGLGSLCNMDTEELRKALIERLSEEDHEIRGEALIGLARLKDQNVKEAIMTELMGEFHGGWVLEAAELMGDPDYCPLLRELRVQLEGTEDSCFLKDIDNAILACC
jgi:HEAT repeat protein